MISMGSMKKIGMLLSLGLLPVILFLFGFLFGLPLFELTFISIIGALILTILAHKMTDTPFLQVFEGKKFGALTIDSRGRIDFFAVDLIGKNFEAEYQDRKIRIPFNQAFFFRLSQVFGRGKIVEKENELSLTLEKKDLNNSLFKTDYPFLLYNRQLNSFITKEFLHSGETKAMLIALGYETNRHIQEYNKGASTITRQIVDWIGTKAKKNGWLMYVLIIIVAAILIWLLAPQIQGALGGVTTTVTGAIENAPLPGKLV